MTSGNPALRHFAIDCLADGEAVAKVTAAARAFAKTLAPVAAARLAIIAEELVSNLIDHGDMPASASIGFALALEAEAVRITLSDAAAPFDPREPVASQIIPARGGSAGLALVRAWAVIDSYEPVDGRNVLTLTLPA